VPIQESGDVLPLVDRKTKLIQWALELHGDGWSGLGDLSLPQFEVYCIAYDLADLNAVWRPCHVVKPFSKLRARQHSSSSLAIGALHRPHQVQFEDDWMMVGRTASQHPRPGTAQSPPHAAIQSQRNHVGWTVGGLTRSNIPEAWKLDWSDSVVITHDSGRTLKGVGDVQQLPTIQPLAIDLLPLNAPVFG
jgi:hypothetical protein